MSRGLGVTQRWVLACLEQMRDVDLEDGAIPNFLTVESLANMRAHQHIEPGDWDCLCRQGHEITRGGLESVRRAVVTLARRGLVETKRHPMTVTAHHVVARAHRVYADDRQRIDSTRYMLSARLPLSVEQSRQVADTQRLQREATLQIVAGHPEIAARVAALMDAS